MVTSTALATRLRWSICPGMPWSVSPGIGGQLAPDWSGHVQQNLHPDAQNIGYAVKSSYLLNLIDLLPQKIDNKKSSTLEGLSFTEKIKELEKFVVIIKTK